MFWWVVDPTVLCSVKSTVRPCALICTDIKDVITVHQTREWVRIEILNLGKQDDCSPRLGLIKCRKR